MKEETSALLEKAKRSIHNAEKTMKDGDLDFAASRAYEDVQNIIDHAREFLQVAKNYLKSK